MTARAAGMYEKLPPGLVVNVCSNGDYAELSPFFLGPCPIPGRGEALRMENAWQFSKVYGRHLSNSGTPNKLWHEWSAKGYADAWAHRYPMGKGARPAYTWWDGEDLDYIAARKQVYVPLYVNAVRSANTFEQLAHTVRTATTDVWLRDYDGYVTTDDFETVLHNPKRKLGHAFVLAGLLNEDPLLLKLLEA